MEHAGMASDGVVWHCIGGVQHDMVADSMAWNREHVGIENSFAFCCIPFQISFQLFSIVDDCSV